MNGRFDKLAPGLAAKLNFAFDEVFVVLTLLLAAAGQPPSFDDRLAVLSLLVALAWFVGAGVLRLYSPCTARTKADSVVLDLIVVAGTTAVLVVAQALLFHGPTLDPVFFAAVLGVGTVSARLLFLLLFVRIEPPIDEVLIVGTGQIALDTYHRLSGHPGERRRVVGFLRLRSQPQRLWGLDVPVFGEADDLLRVLALHPVSEVYLAAPVLKYGAQLQRVVATCEAVGMPFAVPVNVLRFQRAALVGAAGNDGYLHYHGTRASPAQYAIKRLLDIAASAAALVVLSPLLIGVAAAIKLTSPGPVLFKQRRVGLHGATFNLLKFRSMVADAEALQVQLLDKNEQAGPVFKIKNDPRVTVVGRFVRKYSIDELPQLVNVLRGDMTLVGPRPAIPAEVAQYKAWQRRRLSVRPGLTCYWQVGGRNEIAFDEWMRLDLRYVDNWSLTVDVRLILQTVPVVLAGRGAS